jgi:hypothetical protein
MALTTTISPKELERVAALAYEGETIVVMLCSVGATGYTSQSTVAEWQEVEKSGNGYVRYTQVIEPGTFDNVEGRYELPDVDASFTATGAGYLYDRIVLYVEGSTYVHSVLVEDPNIALQADQVQTYRLSLFCDD